MESAFHGASNLAGFSAADNPNLSLVASMFFMFDKATTFNQDIGGWNVENVTNMSTLFFFASAFNQDIGSWHVENVTDMSRLFHGTRAFNQDISNWNVENVTTMRSLFSGAIAFNQDISNWNVSQVTDMFYMFSSTTAFNQNIGNWNVENVTNMSNLFHNATTFNQDISSWNVEGVTNMNSMFESADAFDQNLGLWYVVLSPASTSYDISSGRDIATISAQNSILDNQVSAYALAGVDANQFIITNNQLSFTGDTAGTYNINIEAIDGTFGTSPPTISRQLTITGNFPPVANAGVAQDVDEGALVILGGGLSTDDSAIASYTWTSDIPTLTLTGADTDTAGFTAPEVEDAGLEIILTLTVTDSAGLADSATVLITVNNVLPPDSPLNDFVTVWDMTNSNLDLTFPGYGEYTINWGDGSASEAVNNPNGNNHPSHLYATAGASTVTVSKTETQSGLTRFHLNNSSDSDLLIDVAQWGTSAWTTMESAFRGASNLAGFSATDNPNLSLVQSMFFMFRDAITFNQNIGNWNVSQVTDMFFMFSGATAFNQDIGSWNVSAVTNMNGMFAGVVAFNQNIGNWNVSRVTDMNSMFTGTFAFNQNIGNWNVEGVTNMISMFKAAGTFNQDISSWNVSQVTSMAGMFSGARVFNQNIASWNVANVTNMESLFRDARAFNQNIANWNVSAVTNMDLMFAGAATFNGDISNWDVAGVTGMNSMFSQAVAFNQDISSWNVESATDMSNLLANARAFNQNLALWYVVLSPASTSYDVSTSRDIATIAAQNDILDSQVSTYELTGADADKFTITDSQLIFIHDTVGTYNINIEAIDGTFGTSPPTISRQLIITGNFPPVANAGVAQDVDEGALVTLGGGLSTDDSAIASYTWTSDIPTLTLTGADTDTAGFTAPEVEDAGLEIILTLTVTDSAGLADSATVLITVNNVLPPDSPLNDFVTVWDMTNSNLDLTFPGYGEYTINWGDGSASETVNNPNGNNHPSHLYATAGASTVTVSKTETQSGLTRFHLNNSSDSDLLIDVAQWGTSAWTTMESAFRGASNLAGFSATDNPNLSLVQSMFFMFANASTFNQDIGNWNVENVTSMRSLFSGARAFNQDISNWNVSGVTNMYFMFINARAFNQDIGSWNVSVVTSMRLMFANAKAFNQNIGNWNVSAVTNMNGMFVGATAFSQNIGNWNVESVTDMAYMFSNAVAFNQNIGNWNVSAVTNMGIMFADAAVFNQDISSWNVESVTDMSSLFRNATTFNQDISSWNIEGVTNMISMFLNADAFNQNLGLWYVLLSPASTFYDVSSNRDIATISAQNAVLSSQVSTYALTGIDADKFIITDNQLSFTDNTAGTYNIKIQATDGEFGTNPPTTSYQLTITGTQLNIAPIASAGINQSVNEGAAVRLDGTGSTDNEPITLYGWTADPTITLTGANTNTAGFTAPEVEEAGLDIILTLTVTDTVGVADSATVLVRVNNVVPETAPIASAGINQSVNEGAAVRLDGTGSTDNKPITLYGWTADPTITLTGANTNTAGFTAPEVEEAGLDIILTLTVTDTVGVADSATVLVRVNNVPDADTLDVDENGLFDRMDGMMILRYSFSIRGDGLTRGQTTTSSETVEANIQNAISNSDLDIDASAFLSPEDFIMILRYMISSRGDALTSGQTAISPEIVEDNIKALIP